MSPQGQPGPLDVPQELLWVCGVAPVVEVQEGWGAPLAIPPLPGTAVPPARGRGPASTGHVTGGDTAAIYTLLCQGWAWDISEPKPLARGDSQGPLSAHLSPSTNQSPL